LRRKYEGQDPDSDTSGVARLLDSKKSELQTNDTDRVNKIKLVEGARLSIEQSEASRRKFDNLNMQLKVQDLFIQATSKRGIPVQIINSLLPKINREIAKILKGVVGFTVVLEADLESNAMDVFIDYGDSKRIIELASGMEKMISSLAIRVALINVSSLPKSSMLVIDEGFGSLDETNLEACGRLLQSLKKSFKNILVISHIDQIKDIVDHTIDIVKQGVDSHVTNV
jgi:exonuclease SbcC